MPPHIPRKSPSLGIRLNQDTYAPGDTITGHIYRQKPIVSPLVRAVCKLQGFTSAGRMHKCGDKALSLLKDDWGQPDIYQGPLHIEIDDEERWSFSLRIPLFADEDRASGRYGPSFIPAGERHQLPPTYVLRTAATGDGPLLNTYVEYFVFAKMTINSHGKEEELSAIQPFNMVLYSPDPPIADFKVKRWIHRQSFASRKLAPGRQEVKMSLLEKLKSSFRPNPEFYFDLLVDVPTIIQLDNPIPIPFRLAARPKWEKTSEIIRDVPQSVKLVAVNVELVTCTRTIAAREGYPWETRLDLGVSKAIQNLKRDIYVTSDPIDIGKLINFRIGLENAGFQVSWTRKQDGFTPSFKTFNIEVTHELRYSIHGKVQGEKFAADGKQAVVILRSSGGLPQNNSENPQVREDDESWIVPPPEEAPTSLAEEILAR
ncbi:uncharacterized protein FIESC28_05368 [Fusarium coffeatum]|uniref:Arrestin-like N-terminal domain-containing protein n=1 Tax=Fusarium coffeatum TaxID=231269 RepID=A0A366RSL6_9HYPO|nr:uncharacterized protein FIESC28_05368 [Fusarium coffeatum]RBR20089.1 hypothetical protein FIESC28_05368 [Fusarium coffeatum]